MYRKKMTNNQSGIALFLIIAMVFITFLLFFFLSLTSGQFNYSAHQTLETELATQAGRAFADAFWIFAKDVFQNRKGCDLLYPPAGSASPLYPFRKENLEKIEARIDDFEKADEIKKTFAEIQDQLPGLSKLDTVLHFKVRKSSDSFAQGDLCLKVNFKLKNTTYSFDYFREFKLIRCLAPVLAKFSLFLRNNSGGNSYNQISKKFQDEYGQNRAFFVFNQDKTFLSASTDTWQRSGWIYLGGPPVTLNLDGTHPCRKESDSFIFWPGLYSDNLSQALPYACSDYLGNSKLRVRFAPTGAILDWENSALLKSILGGANIPFVLKSSVLRLFGNRELMTPTKIFGRVYTNFVVYSTMILDTNNDSVADNVVSSQGIEQRAIFPLPRLADSELFSPPIFPRFVTSKGFDLFLDAAGINGIPDRIEEVFNSYNAGNPNYAGYMTKMARDFAPDSGMDSYNALYDQIFQAVMVTGSKSFPAPRNFRADEYPNNGTDIRIPLDFSSSENQFEGDLTRFNPGAFFEDLNIYGRVYNDSGDFFQYSAIKFEHQTYKIFDPIVSKISGSLKLDNSLQANAPAIIVAEEDLEVNEILKSENSSKLTLVSLNGNIKITGRKLQGVSLIAPNGTIEWKTPVEISGTLCAENISPATFAIGGTLAWDPEMDITDIDTAARSVAFLVGPDITLIRKAN
ncbi:MAG: hypothetical protein ACQETH_14440 [Candidatus Rifleibacteriota bacterium]